MKRCLMIIIAIILSWCYTPNAWAFCGFYVAKADAKLYNKASQVVIARDGNRTILTMANDYQGKIKDFALVVPVPVVLKKEQVRIADSQIIKRLDEFSAPRLVEYFDPNPCQPIIPYPRSLPAPVPAAPVRQRQSTRDQSLGVTVEAQFSVGEYDIVILSAKESSGLQKWLNINGYKIPTTATKLLQPYIRQEMKFFVAKVNLKQLAKSGSQLLRPIQIAYESPKYILPIRLGMVNGQGEQDLLVYILSPLGQAMITNYRTVNIPSNIEIPVYVKDSFGSFYQAMFANSYKKGDRKVGFLEYAWNMNSCDPCSSEPLNREELKRAGVFWLDQPNKSVFITRFHIRYSRDKFPEDIAFQSTRNQQLFQGRYVMNHIYKGDISCEAGTRYKKTVLERNEKEAVNLAKLTGWNLAAIRAKMNLRGQVNESWWDGIWKKSN